MFVKTEDQENKDEKPTPPQFRSQELRTAAKIKREIKTEILDIKGELDKETPFAMDSKMSGAIAELATRVAALEEEEREIVKPGVRELMFVSSKYSTSPGTQ